MLAPSIGVQLIDSEDITTYLMERYPTLRPEAHKQTIDSLLHELHQISYVTLSFKPEERRIEGVMDFVRQLQDRPDTSERYRGMLQKKYDKYVHPLSAKNSTSSKLALLSCRSTHALAHLLTHLQRCQLAQKIQG